MTGIQPAGARTFVFEHDTFGFRNELVWEYRVDPGTGQTTTRCAAPPPTYAHRCFVMVRSCRQFFQHARFEPGSPALDPAERSRRIRTVVRRNPRRVSAEPDRVVFPGFRGLRDFSIAHAPDLRAQCGGAWQSYALRSHWRMVFPITRRHQARQAEALQDRLRAGRLPIVHIVRFPQLTINHGLLLFGFEADATGVSYAAYDPNVPEQPASVRYDERSRTFTLPPNRYWAGGRVDVIEIHRSWFF